MGFGLFDPSTADEPVLDNSAMEDPNLKAMSDDLDDFLFSPQMQADTNIDDASSKNPVKVRFRGSHASADMSRNMLRRRE